MRKILTFLTACVLIFAILPINSAFAADLKTFKNARFSFQYEDGMLSRVVTQAAPAVDAGEMTDFDANGISFIFLEGENNNYIFFKDLSGSSWNIILSSEVSTPEGLRQIASAVKFTFSHKANRKYGHLTPYNKDLLASGAKVFDDCPGLDGYKNMSFYDSLIIKLSEAKIYTTKDGYRQKMNEGGWGWDFGGYVKDACYSENAQKVIMLVLGAGDVSALIGVAEYDTKEGGLSVSRVKAPWFPTPREFGLREKYSVQIPIKSCNYTEFLRGNGLTNQSKICTDGRYSYNLLNRKVRKVYSRNRRVTQQDIDEKNWE